MNIRRSCEDSLRRLRTDHIDLYQMHHVDRSTPWDEIWEAMAVLRTQGKIIYVGSSNFAGWHIAQAQEAARRHGAFGLVSEQSLYNLAVRTVELEVLPACQGYGLGVLPWSPLHGGLLGGILRKQGGRGAAAAGGPPRPWPACARRSRRTRRSAPSSARTRPQVGAGLAAAPARGHRADRRAAHARTSSTGRCRRWRSRWTTRRSAGWTRSSPAPAAPRPRRTRGERRRATGDAS